MADDRAPASTSLRPGAHRRPASRRLAALRRDRPEQRAALAAAVAVQRRRDRPARGRRGPVRQRAPASCWRSGAPRGRRRGTTNRAVDADAGVHRPRRRARTRQRVLRARARGGVRPRRIRPHERTHPGPKEDRLRLTRATRANLSPIFSLYSDPTGDAWAALRAAAARAARARRPTPTAPSTGLARHRPRRDRRGQARYREHRAADRRRPSPLRDRARLCRGDRRRGRAPLRADVPGGAAGSGAHRLPDPPARPRPGRDRAAERCDGDRSRFRAVGSLDDDRRSWRPPCQRRASGSATSTRMSERRSC